MAMLDNDNKRLSEEKGKLECIIQSLTTEVKELTSARDKYEWEARNLHKELEETSNETDNKVNAERDRLMKVLNDTKLQYEQMLRQLKEADEKHHAEAMHEQQVRFDETIAKVTAEMKAATETMLKERQKDFADSSNETLGQIVNPLRETIDKMKQAMAETTEKQTAMSSEMKVSIEHMMRQSEAAKLSA
ncbi:MAG: DNA recombination protein RmuC, partial [Bacteroidaceae bacterium]|nr:DNA recombination protein RmuC [Bacteroidaceae bacterium]